MTVTFAYCAIVIAGISAELGEPVSPSRQNPPPQPLRPQASSSQSTSPAQHGQSAPQAALHGQPARAPWCKPEYAGQLPTDPRAFTRDDLPSRRP